MIFRQEFDKLVQLDQEWRDHFSQTNIPMRQSAEEEEKRQFMFDSLAAGTSFAQVLMDQVRETDLTDEQRGIAELIIGNIDDYGYLKATVEEMAASNNLPADQIAEVLKVIQTFDPPGVGASDLRECLHAAARTRRPAGFARISHRARPHGSAGQAAHPGNRPRHRLAPSRRRRRRIGRIARLEPRPGRAFLPDTNQYVLPEVFVQKAGDDFIVTTNDEHIPHLRISNIYKDLMSQGGNSAEVKNYIREKIRAGKFLIKSLHQRQQTILNIGKQIVKRQRDFMEKGVVASEAADHGADRRGRGRPRNHRQPRRVRQIHADAAGRFRDEIFLHRRPADRQRRRRVQHQREGHDRRDFQGRRPGQAACPTRKW